MRGQHKTNTTENAQDVTSRIRSLRKSKGVSQGKAAAALGLNQSQYSRRELGHIPFTMNELLVLKAFLNASHSEIFGEGDDQNSKYKEMSTKYAQAVSQYEIRLKEKNDIIASLKEQIRLLERIVYLNKQSV